MCHLSWTEWVDNRKESEKCTKTVLVSTDLQTHMSSKFLLIDSGIFGLVTRTAFVTMMKKKKTNRKWPLAHKSNLPINFTGSSWLSFTQVMVFKLEIVDWNHFRIWKTDKCSDHSLNHWSAVIGQPCRNTGRCVVQEVELCFSFLPLSNHVCILSFAFANTVYLLSGAITMSRCLQCKRYELLKKQRL